MQQIANGSKGYTPRTDHAGRGGQDSWSQDAVSEACLERPRRSNTSLELALLVGDAVLPKHVRHLKAQALKCLRGLLLCCSPSLSSR